MDDDLPVPPPPAGWAEALANSEAELEAGETVSGESVMRELHDSISRLEARQGIAPQRKAAPHR